ncbi:target of rapamycin complex 2 subunit MAPKAP1-like [Penaeus chinensis]|uniref:target of rapamycin complex 2 subunit MAPKAP1-like n=1 Tax=Penaeus chinensis TaxID=139456 RepID=UPI001FB6A555|nr:target of rapamycin complex 2 subunit MAPKAP1-like [Penaeus chinensis]
MATYDDRQWILSHIQNSYVTSDDTGLCEVVVQNEPAAAPVAEFPCLADSDSPPPHIQDEPPPHSLEIASDMDFVGHRQRSYTDQRLEIMRKEKKNASKIKRITWKHNPAQINENELNELFSRKAVISNVDQTDISRPHQPPPISLLTRLVQQYPEGIKNPFIEYAKYDGTTHTNVQARRISVYLLLGDNTAPSYPMVVSVVNCHQARVSDLIGLICWLYTKENREPPLRGSVENYALHIAEEDGQVDWDFQALNNRDVIEKFGFNILALVEKKNVPEASKDIVVTLNVAGGAFSKITVENLDITLKEILSRTITKRKDMGRIIDAGLDYHLERENEPGIALDAEKTLADVNCTEFAVVRDNSKRIDLPLDPSNMSTVEATLYRSYKVTWLLKLGKCEACLGISGDKFEIHPLQQKMGGAFLPLRTPHAVTYNMELVVDCSRKAEKKGKMEIQVTCQGENRFKDYLFECEAKIGQEILDKCKHIFDLRTSTARKEFWREKKPFRRHNSLSMRHRPRTANHANEV